MSNPHHISTFNDSWKPLRSRKFLKTLEMQWINKRENSRRHIYMKCSLVFTLKLFLQITIYLNILGLNVQHPIKTPRWWIARYRNLERYWRNHCQQPHQGYMAMDSTSVRKTVVVVASSSSKTSGESMMVGAGMLNGALVWRRLVIIHQKAECGIGSEGGHNHIYYILPVHITCNQ